MDLITIRNTYLQVEMFFCEYQIQFEANINHILSSNSQTKNDPMKSAYKNMIRSRIILFKIQEGTSRTMDNVRLCL